MQTQSYNYAASRSVTAELSIHQIKPALDSFNALIHAIQPPIDARQPFLNVSHPDLHIPHVVNQAINALLHARQARLDLLQRGHNEVSDFAHTHNLICSSDVPQARTIGKQ